MPTNKFFIYLFIYSASIVLCLSEKVCGTIADQCQLNTQLPRYILYDVNYYEGFNLRRDVYMRLAILFHRLKQDGVNWKLILPPWDNLPHWRSAEAGNQALLPWGLFFDLQSLQSYAPVVEMFEFLEDYQNVTIDRLIILQHYENIWKDNFTWTEKWNPGDCRRHTNFVKGVDGLFEGYFSGYEMSAKEVMCVSFQGSAALLKKVIEAFPGRFIAVQHAETIIHDFYGGSDFWKCRASMKFSKNLLSIATSFKNKFFPSTQSREETNNLTLSVGDPYLCIHLRRRDYLSSHPTRVPSIKWAAKQVKEKLIETNLDIVFLASDAFDEEIKKFTNELLPYKVIKYSPSVEVLRQFKDGGVAIIEQIICSHARFFIGTYESTFSFRIQEERELLNFHPNSTFNRLCGNDEINCKQPTRWRKTD